MVKAELNPFAHTIANEESPHLDRELRLALPDPGRPLQILGASGFGKTTCLRFLARVASEQGLSAAYLYVPPCRA